PARVVQVTVAEAIATIPRRRGEVRPGEPSVPVPSRAVPSDNRNGAARPVKALKVSSQSERRKKRRVSPPRQLDDSQKERLPVQEFRLRRLREQRLGLSSTPGPSRVAARPGPYPARRQRSEG